MKHLALVLTLLMFSLQCVSKPIYIKAPDPPVEEVLCLAKNLYFEARGEGNEGMRAVGHVTKNRVDSGRWPDTYCGVVHKKSNNALKPGACSFSWTCNGKESVVDDAESEEWLHAITLSWKILTKADNHDPTMGAKHYVRCGIFTVWMLKLQFKTQIGRHCFYE